MLMIHHIIPLWSQQLVCDKNASSQKTSVWYEEIRREESSTILLISQVHSHLITD